LHRYKLRREKRKLLAQSGVVADILLKQKRSRETVSVLESIICMLTEDYDKKTRELIFDTVNHIIDAKQVAEKTCLVDDNMISGLTKNKDVISASTSAKIAVDHLLDNFGLKVPKSVHNDIIKAAVLRLIIDLPQEDIHHVLANMLPEKLDKKQREDSHYMFG